MRISRKSSITLLGLILTSGVFLCGCKQPEFNPGQDIIPPPPIKPLADETMPLAWYYDWVDQEDRKGPEVDDMLFILSARGRSWREPAGPDGYAIRAILLDSNGQPTKVSGKIRVFVVQDPDRKDALPLFAWQLDCPETERRFVKDGWPGYLLQLDWEKGPSKASGTYMLVVRWVSADGKLRFTRNVVFEDVIGHEVTTTTRPIGALPVDRSGIAGQPER